MEHGTMRSRLPYGLVLVVALGCDVSANVRVGVPDGAVAAVDANLIVEFDDADGDGISDVAEDRATDVDTDGDGTPDYLDLDSDDDGLSDALESGNPRDGRAIDVDGDGVPNFRDDDADGNGILDRDEGDTDRDLDGLIDAIDLDDDGDLLPDLLELADMPSAPPDFDEDGTADFQDIDSDGDTIGDRSEGAGDSDRDGIDDRFDDDTDADGLLDSVEAGDASVDTPPVDTDGDGDPDFRDPDSDNDGLSDADEELLGTDRLLADTDGDGVSDLVEVEDCRAGGTPDCEGDVLDPAASPRSRGNFVFSVPFESPPTPRRDTLSFATNLREADIYFLVDTTGSMGGAIDNVQASLQGEDGIIASVRELIGNPFFGVGEFKDYAAGPEGAALPYGGEDDYAYRNLQDLTDVDADIQAGVDALDEGGGGDGPESHLPALTAMITGDGLPGASDGAGSLPARTDCLEGAFGWPCFRRGAVPVVVLISDALMHNGPMGSDPYDDLVLGGPAPDYGSTVAALEEGNARVIGVAVRAAGITNPVRQQMASLAEDTGAVDGTRLPLVSPAPDGLVSAAVINQIRILASQTTLDISVRYVDLPDAGAEVDTFGAFVDRIEANTEGDRDRGCAPRPAIDNDGDGVLDTFPDVRPGDPVCFDIVVRTNATVMPTDEPQLFQGRLDVLGDGFTVLDERTVTYLVPPEVLITGPD
jgi:hypothetical protein